MRRLLVALAALMLFVAACVEAVLVDPAGGGGGGGSGATGGGGVGGAGGAQGGGGSGGATCSCEDMDVVLLIDNTTSHDFISQLVTSFLQLPGKITELSSRACSFHFGVVTSTPQLNNPTNCQMLGAFSTVNSSAQSCGLANGKFATEEDDLLNAIPCLAQTGRQSANGTERLMDALFLALEDPTLNGPGGCNEDFFRPDAPLLILIISDIDDTLSADDPAQWFGRLRTLNGNTASKMSAMGILPPASLTPCNNSDGPQLAPRLHGFLGQFDSSRQLSADLCNVGATELADGVQAIADAVCPAP